MQIYPASGNDTPPAHVGRRPPALYVSLIVSFCLFSSSELYLSEPLKTLDAGATLSGEWPQWGGLQRNFRSDVKGLAEWWPSQGPARLWSRELGQGYSSIAVDGGVLYTMFRHRDDESVIALDAETGKTLWTFSYPAPFPPQINVALGPGPHATPLITNSRVFSVGATGKFFALDKKSGQKLWAHDLWADFGGQFKSRGYSCSPLLYKNRVILPVGGRRGQTVVAFDAETGEVAWKSLDFGIAYSSPFIINFAGHDQLVLFAGAEVLGMNPDSGELLWMVPHETPGYGANVSPPVWGEDGLLFTSSSVGSRAIKLTNESGKTVARELWFTNRMRVFLGNVIRIGRYLYGSSGDIPAVFTALDIETGEIVWRERKPKTSLIAVENKLIMLDEDGTLSLASVSPDGMTVESDVQATQAKAWTPPTLVNRRLYLRDQAMILAFGPK